MKVDQSQAMIGTLRTFMVGLNYQLDYVSQDNAELSFDVNIRMTTKLDQGRRLLEYFETN